jgi:hypothetical protein
LILALVAGFLGFGGIAGTAAGTAQDGLILGISYFPRRVTRRIFGSEQIDRTLTVE